MWTVGPRAILATLTLFFAFQSVARSQELTSHVEIADRMRTIYRLSTMGRRFQDKVAPSIYKDSQHELTWRQFVMASVMVPHDEDPIPATGATRSELSVISLFSLERNVDRMTSADAKARVQAVVGPGTFFEITAKRPGVLSGPARIKSGDPIADAILFVEVYEQKINWADRGDFEVPDAEVELSKEQFDKLGNSTQTFHVTFADGEVWLISRAVPKAVLSRFFYVEEARQVDRETELEGYVVDTLGPLRDVPTVPLHLLPKRD